MKTTTFLLRLAIALLSASLATSQTWDLRLQQLDASGRPREVLVTPAANSLLGFDGSKRAVNVTPGPNIVISGNQISAAGSVTNNGTLTENYLVIGGGGAEVRPTTIPVTGGNNIVFGNITAGSVAIGNVTGATSDFELPWIGDQATGKFFKGNITVGANMTRNKVGNNIVLDAVSGEGGSLPGGMATLWPTPDLGSLPAGFFPSGQYGTDGPDTLFSRTVVVRSLGTVANPTVDIAPGAVPAGTVVTMSTATDSPFFTATNNGTPPTYTIGAVGNTFTVSANGTWQYRANKAGWVSSAVQSATYTIDPIPTLSSAVLQASGTDIVIGWPESVSYGAGGTGGYALTLSGGAATVTGVTGGGTNSHTLTVNRTVTNTETGTLAYTQPGNGAEDSAGQDVVTFTGFTVDTSGGPAPGGGVPTPDLLHWPLDDAAGTTIVADVGPGTTSNTGTLNGDYLAMANANSAFQSTSNVTWGTNVVSVSFWLRVPGFSTNADILRSVYISGVPRWTVGLYSMEVRVGVSGASGSRTESITGALTASTWTHVVAVFDNSTEAGDVKLFLNGTEQTLSSVANDKTGTANFVTDQLSIKSIFGETSEFDLDDLRVYSGELSGAQISAIYTAGRP